jgi:molybdopterin converting factor small subunit
MAARTDEEGEGNNSPEVNGADTSSTLTFRLSGNLLRFSNFVHEVDVVAPTIEEGLRALVSDLPQLERVLLDGKGQPRAVHRFFRNGELVSREDLAQPVEDGDEVTILTAIAGGCAGVK